MIRRGIVAGVIIVAAAGACACRTERPRPSASPAADVKPGIEILLEKRNAMAPNG